MHMYLRDEARIAAAKRLFPCKYWLRCSQTVAQSIRNTQQDSSRRHGDQEFASPPHNILISTNNSLIISYSARIVNFLARIVLKSHECKISIFRSFNKTI